MARFKMEVGLNFTVHREGKYFVAHSPAIDISTAGKSVAEAKKRFGEAAQLFLEELTKDPQRLDSALKDLGWEKKEHKWSPPVPVSHENVRVRIPA